MVCDPKLTDDYINRILAYLQGWVICDEAPLFDSEYAQSYLHHNDIDDSLNEVNHITKAELEIFYQKGKEATKSWIWFDYIPLIPPVHEGMLMWTAGLIWKKYNVKENELMDQTNAYGYGDQLIAQAKKLLQPYIRTRLRGL